MRKQLRDGDIFLPGLRKLRPELPHPSVDVDLVFLQNVQQAGAPESFCCRPNQNDGVLIPSLLPARIAKATVKIEQLFSILPDRNGCAELTELFEIFLKQRLEAQPKFVGIELHSSRA